MLSSQPHVPRECRDKNTHPAHTAPSAGCRHPKAAHVPLLPVKSCQSAGRTRQKKLKRGIFRSFFFFFVGMVSLRKQVLCHHVLHVLSVSPNYSPTQQSNSTACEWQLKISKLLNSWRFHGNRQADRVGRSSSAQLSQAAAGAWVLQGTRGSTSEKGKAQKPQWCRGKAESEDIAC